MAEILAAVLISRHPEKYAIDFEPDAPLIYESVEIDGSADLQVLARCAGSDLDTMKRIKAELTRIHPRILLYGEPWAVGPTLLQLHVETVEEMVIKKNVVIDARQPFRFKILLNARTRFIRITGMTSDPDNNLSDAEGTP